MVKFSVRLLKSPYWAREYAIGDDRRVEFYLYNLALIENWCLVDTDTVFLLSRGLRSRGFHRGQFIAHFWGLAR